MGGRNYSGRYIIIVGIMGLLVLACIIRLFNLQVVKGKEYGIQAEQRLVRAFPVTAPRGEILDRYGKPFVENRMGFNVQLQKIDMSSDELNDLIVSVNTLVKEYGGSLSSDFPIYYDEENEFWEYTFNKSKKEKKSDSQDELLAEETEDIDEEAAKKLKEEQAAQLQEWKEKHNLTQYEKPQDIVNYYCGQYSIAGKYTEADKLAIVAVRYDMEKSEFSEKTPYVMAHDVDEVVVQQLKERAMNFPGVEVETEPIRVYAEEKMAAHILGRTGKIYAEEYEELKGKGYGINDIIGKDGLEKLLEPYLKGKDGYRSVSMGEDEENKDIIKTRTVEPGNYARLSLDRDVQRAMEKSLEENITKAVDRNGSGGAIAIIPGTGEVLAMASYPSYDPSTFDEDYEKLVQAKSRPLFNKVLNGVYSPGSTFKPLTAIAGLETGIITPNTYIEDKGKYTYFDSYQPTCLVYSSKGVTHGNIEVSEAIGVSCNYFFYEVGRLVGIEKLNEYAEKFGLGQPTGIELGESKGLVANPEHRKELGQEWYPGDVIQAAIGQSDNLFTPAQLASYIATVVNKGRRYKLHLVNEIVDYDTGEIVHRENPQLLSENPISEATLNKVKDGMRQVVTMGTAKEAFADAEYKAAGKTGTAEVPDGADNVLFVGFAPYEKPEIVIAVVIEHGASSFYAASVARDVFDAYMKLKEERNTPEEEREKNKEKDEEGGETGESEPTSSRRPKPTATLTSNRGVAPGTTETEESSGILEAD